MSIRFDSYVGDGQRVPFERLELATELPAPGFSGVSRIGSIVIDIDGFELIDVQLWDEIDQHWKSLVHGVTEMLQTGVSKPCWPSQAIYLNHVRYGAPDDPWLHLQVFFGDDPIDDAQAHVHLREYVTACAAGAIEFFDRAEQLDDKLQGKFARQRELIAGWSGLL